MRFGRNIVQTRQLRGVVGQRAIRGRHCVSLDREPPQRPDDDDEERLGQSAGEHDAGGARGSKYIGWKAARDEHGDDALKAHERRGWPERYQHAAQEGRDDRRQHGR
jgi:hypothetical protein